jgi:hypothetical protein
MQISALVKRNLSQSNHYMRTSTALGRYRYEDLRPSPTTIEQFPNTAASLFARKLAPLSNNN